MKMRLVVSGGSGLLALNWALQMRNSWDVHLLLHRRQVSLDKTSCHLVDLSNLDSAVLALKKINPDLVINAAALTDVDLCQTNQRLGFISNVDVAVNLATAAHELGVKFIQISTDQLFDGERSHYTEEDLPTPLNQYALTKLKAEKGVMLQNPAALVLRTNFFGWGPPYKRSFSDWILDGLREGKVLNMYRDVFFTPIYIENLIKLAHELAAIEKSGIFNIVGDNRLSKYEFALLLCDKFGLDSMLINPINLANSKSASVGKALRPLDMSLSNKKLASSTGSKGLSLEEMLDAMFEMQWKQRALKQLSP